MLCLVLALILVLRAWPTFFSVVDDAYISARYAAHFAAGHGLVYNVGERVEGYTDLAWIVMLSGALRLGVPMQHALPGLGLAFGITGLCASMLLSRRLGARGPVDVALPALLLALDPHYAVASTIGLESTQFVTATMLAAWAVLTAKGRLRWAAGIACGATMLVRPEGHLVAFVLASYDAHRHRRSLAKPAGWAVAAPTIAIMSTALAFRLHTYGHALPNTFVAKAHRDVLAQGMRNATYYAPDAPYWFALVAILAFATFILRRRRFALALVLLTLGLAASAFRVHEWMPGARLLLPSVALTVCLLGAALSRAPARLRVPVRTFVLVGSVGLVVGPLPKNVRAYDAHTTVQPGSGAEAAARIIGPQLPPGATLATRDAGVLAFFVGPDVRVAELHERALTQPHPGGRDADPRTYTPEHPELIVLTAVGTNAVTPAFAPERDLWTRLAMPYDFLGRVRLHAPRYYDFYARADLHLARLPETITIAAVPPSLPLPR